MSASTPERNIVIIGGGIIGCTTAYYLADHPSFATSGTKVTILEASKNGVAQGASGKAGGLVARWAYPKELVNVSFPEHVRLAEKHDGASRWGWRFVGCGSWEGRGEVVEEAGTGGGKSGQRRSLEKTLGLSEDWKKKRAALGLPDDLDWVRDDLTDGYSPMAPSGHTAQVHPYQFTTSMLELAKEKGVKLVHGKATSINIDSASPTVTGVTYTNSTTGEENTVPASHVVLSAGAWSPRILPSLPIQGTRAHSITIRPEGTIAPYVLFTEITLPSSASKRATSASPEIYARPDHEVYCCGPGDSSPVPDTVDDVEVDQSACDSIREHVASISKQLREGVVEKRQACFLPTVSSGGGPIVGEAKTLAKGLVIATGHTCWGISNAPGTAKAVAELIMDGKISCANFKNLNPSRFF